MVILDDYSVDCEFVPWTSRFLTGWMLVIVTMVVYGGSLVFCSYESDGDGGDPGLVTEWIEGVGVVLKWC